MVNGIQNQKSLQNDEIHIAIYGSHDGKSKRWELIGNKNDPYFREAVNLAVKHPPKRCFPRFPQQRNPFPNVTIGDWHADICKVDWDERFFCEVNRYSKILVKRFPVLGGGYIIFQSSTKLHKIRNDTFTDYAYAYRSKSYHTVFNGEVSKDELQSILAWLCLFTKDTKLTTWFLLQLIKGSYTLRIGFKGRKKPPRIVYRYGNQDKGIAKFLKNRKFIHGLLEDADDWRR
jgi:hypothetical protein